MKERTNHHKDNGVSFHLDCSKYDKGQLDLLAKLDGITITEEVRNLFLLGKKIRINSLTGEQNND